MLTGCRLPDCIRSCRLPLGRAMPSNRGILDAVFPAGAGEVVDKLDFAAFADFEAGSVIAIVAFGEGNQFPVVITGLQDLV